MEGLLVSVQCLGGILDVFKEQEAGVLLIKPSDHKQTCAGLTLHCNHANFFLPSSYTFLFFFSLTHGVLCFKTLK